MNDDDGQVHSTSELGIVASHPARALQPLRVAPTTGADFNTVSPDLIPVACLKLSDALFDFDSSFVTPESGNILKALPALRASKKSSKGELPPLSVFAHADPVGDDPYNKQLSGRRAQAIYGLLKRDTAIWDDLYDHPYHGDNWKTGNALRAMTDYLGVAEDTPREEVFKSYMAVLCPFVLTNDDFLARGLDPKGKGDFQGCGKFNPLVLLSISENQKLKAEDRNEENRPNRRVSIFLFAAGSKVNAELWPCPRAFEGITECRKRLFSNGEQRRAYGAKRKLFADTRDTFACRFYDRIAHDSPCEIKPVPIQKVRIVIRGANGKVRPCTIVPTEATIKLRAVPSKDTGTYAWSTTSAKITLADADTDTVTITALKQVSAAKDGEAVQVVFTLTGGSALDPVTVGVTVISVAFSKSANQKYGYDDMDKAAGVLHHVSVKKNDDTKVQVTIKGGVTAGDLQFTSDDASTAEPAVPASAGPTFDLTINGKAKDKAETAIRARCNCPDGTICATIQVNVYKEKTVSATVAKVFDSKVAATALSRPNLDVKAAATQINTEYKAPVVTLTLADQSASGGAIDVHYDLDGDGRLTLEAGGIGNEIAAITAAFNPPGQKIIIVKDLAYIFYLEKAANKGDTKITVKASYGGNIAFLRANTDLAPGESSTTYQLTSGANQEGVIIASKAANVLTLTAPLKNPHTTSDGLLFPAGGLGGNPIILPESTSSTEDLQRWVIGHESGHALMGWHDLDAADNLMNFSMGWTDHKLRFKPQPNHYNPPGGTENQWETVSR